jgi:ketosteroid isomerase-like protein
MTSADEPVDTVRRFLEAAARDDLPGTLECLHPDLEWVPLRARTEGAFQGHEGYERFRSDTWEHYERFEPEVELIEVGERVVSSGVVHVRGKESGVEMEVATAGVFEFRDGMIVRWHDFGSEELALAEARRLEAEETG